MASENWKEDCRQKLDLLIDSSLTLQQRLVFGEFLNQAEFDKHFNKIFERVDKMCIGLGPQED